MGEIALGTVTTEAPHLEATAAPMDIHAPPEPLEQAMFDKAIEQNILQVAALACARRYPSATLAKLRRIPLWSLCE